MSILNDLQRALRAVRPPCKTCPYWLGIVKCVQSPCPMCMASGYSTYDTLTRQRADFPGIWRGGLRRDGADDGRMFGRRR